MMRNFNTNVYSSPSIIRVIKSRKTRETGGMTWVGERCVNRDLVGKPEGKRPFGKPRSKWKYNIKICLK
jgi:hypothetical protein